MGTRILLQIALAIGAFPAGCGGEGTMASKSAKAYDDAVARGVPIETGRAGHHGHGHVDAEAVEKRGSATGETAPSTSHDGSAEHHAGSAQHHAGSAEHHAGSAEDHIEGRGDSAGHHGEPSSGAATQHAPATEALPPLDSTVDVNALDPSTTLESDAIDAPAPASVAEAQKAASRHSSHEGGGR